MAGLWEVNHKISAEKPIWSATIITTDANSTTSFVHDRMPAILDGDQILEWLNPEQHEPSHLRPILRPASEDYFELTEVGTRVNNPMNEGEECLWPPGGDSQNPSKEAQE